LVIFAALAVESNMTAARMSAPTESTVLAIRLLERTIKGASCFSCGAGIAASLPST